MSHRPALAGALLAAAAALCGYVWMVRRLSMAPTSRRRWQPAEPVLPSETVDGIAVFGCSRYADQPETT